jgi:ATP citrate (pro-S)-lyase
VGPTVRYGKRSLPGSFREALVTIGLWRDVQEGLKLMRKLGPELRIPIHVSGPEAHITAVVQQALGIPLDDGMKMTSAVIDRMAQEGLTSPVNDRATSPAHAPPDGSPVPVVTHGDIALEESIGSSVPAASSGQVHTQFSPQTRCVVYGMQTRAVQGMLDFDFLCGRKTASVAAMVFPFSGNHFQKFYWGDTEIMLPVLSSTEEALKRNPDVDTFVNFASFRSVYSSTVEALAFPQVKTIAIIAEGVPEQHARMIIKEADARGVLIIGPATVGGITPGCFRIGNTGGMLDNVVACKLYRPGSVAYVSKSGGMSNELNNILARVTDGVAEGTSSHKHATVVDCHAQWWLCIRCCDWWRPLLRVTVPGSHSAVPGQPIRENDRSAGRGWWRGRVRRLSRDD